MFETEGSRVQASPASLHCGSWARHIYPSVVLVQRGKTRPYLTESLLMGHKESNQTNKRQGMFWKFWFWCDISVTSNAICLKMYQIKIYSLSIHSSDKFFGHKVVLVQSCSDNLSKPRILVVEKKFFKILSSKLHARFENLPADGSHGHKYCIFVLHGG